MRKFHRIWLEERIPLQPIHQKDIQVVNLGRDRVLLLKEQLVSSPQHSGPVIEQLNLSKITTSFPVIQEERVVIPDRKEGIPTFTYPFKTKENPLQKPFYINTNFELNPFSLLGNMADEEEGPRVENQDRPKNDEQTFGFPILDLAQNTNMKNINPSILLTFHRMSTKDPEPFYSNLIYCAEAITT